MNINPLHILLIEDEVAHADWIDAILADEDIPSIEPEGYQNYSRQFSQGFERNGEFQPLVSYAKITHVQRLSAALEYLATASFDVVLLDLSLPDSQGMEGIVAIKQKAPLVPVIVLTGLNNRALAISALRHGVQDYLIKGKFTAELLASSIRYAIERQKAETALRQQALMKTMLDRIRQSLDLNTILSSTVTEVQHFLRTDRVSIYSCCDAQSGTIIAQADNNHSPSATAELTSDSLKYCLQQSQSSIVAIDDTNISTVSLPDKDSTRSILAIAIWRSKALEEYFVPGYLTPSLSETESIESPQQPSSERLWGLLVAYNCDRPRQWQQWEVDFLTQLTTQVSIAIQQSELYRQLKLANQELERLAILDGLTGVANRRYFDVVLEKEWQRLAREQKPISLMLCDIDFFKLYNDTYGHPAGDSALQTVAQVLHSAIRRPADLVARYGGEEFALILPDTDLQGAACVGNLIRHNLAQLELVHQKSAVSKYLTLSIGLVTEIPDSKRSPYTLVEAADRLLYEAKRAGRNRIFTGEELAKSVSPKS